MSTNLARKAAFSSMSDGLLAQTPESVRFLPEAVPIRSSESTAVSELLSSPTPLPRMIQPSWLVELRVPDDETFVYELIKQQWSGVVVDFNDEEVHVVLQDLSNPNNPNEYAIIFREEIDTHQQSLVKNGAIFYWHIGYREGKKSPRQKFSKIRFRNLPKWTQSEIDLSSKKAKEYADFFSED